MSLVDTLAPLFRFLPEVKAPEMQHSLQKRLLITLGAMILFFIMGNINLIGLSPAATTQLGFIQQLLASELGTLITVGIGPIVLASIILQLLIGGKILDMDLSDPLQRANFSSLQKLLAVFLSFFEAAAYAGFGLFPSLIQPLPGIENFLFVVLQISIGSLLLLYLDEVVSKHGVGSGIGLFIAAGVSKTFFWQVFAPTFINANGNLIQGALFTLFANLADMSVVLPIILAIAFAFVIFFAVVFAEGIHVNIPLAMGPRGVAGRFPVKFLYVSNMPVILAGALFANIQLWAAIVQGQPIISDIIGGIAWMTSVPRLGQFSLIEAIIGNLYATQFPWDLILIEVGHAFLFVSILVILSMIFGRFWIEMGNQGSDAVSKQLIQSGMSVPGFRRDPRIIKGILDRYIPPISLLGGGFVGLLAGTADLITGSLVSGTGILLTVGIVYRMYEEIAKAQVLESNMLLKKLFGG